MDEAHIYYMLDISNMLNEKSPACIEFFDNV